MNALDSRSLRTGNCFGQKFSVPGEIHYFLSAGGEMVPAAGERSEGGFVIVVKPAAAGRKSQQHNVQVTRNGNDLEPSPAKLEIHAGEGVLAHGALEVGAGDGAVAGKIRCFHVHS